MSFYSFAFVYPSLYIKSFVDHFFCYLFGIYNIMFLNLFVLNFVSYEFIYACWMEVLIINNKKEFYFACNEIGLNASQESKTTLSAAKSLLPYLK